MTGDLVGLSRGVSRSFVVGVGVMVTTIYSRVSLVGNACNSRSHLFYLA
jgi:hypothetical protein